ncbi:hypothetical protein HK104_008254 [Borealophlyctis nickersoniae]|nr:hypothetical protein HK104_008254 [Borealophlyctis nickersoniae]
MLGEMEATQRRTSERQQKRAEEAAQAAAEAAVANAEAEKERLAKRRQTRNMGRRDVSVGKYREVDTDDDLDDEDREVRTSRKKRKVENKEMEAVEDGEDGDQIMQVVEEIEGVEGSVGGLESVKKGAQALRAEVRSYLPHVQQQRTRFLYANRHLFIPLLPSPNYFDKPTSVPTGSTCAPLPYEEVEQPKGVKAVMKEYQLKGLSFLEIARWTPEFTALKFHGTAAERIRLKQHCVTNKYDIIVTSYDQYLTENGWFKHAFTWRYVVLDEGHKIKNNETSIAMALQGLRAQFRLILSGTPLQNNLHELWALFHWLYPEGRVRRSCSAFKSVRILTKKLAIVFTEKTAQKFRDSFDLTRGLYDGQMLEDSRKLLERIMLRRLKSVVELNIPPKEEMTIYLPLTPMQRFWYSRLLMRMDRMTLDEIFANPSRGGSDGGGPQVKADPDAKVDSEEDKKDLRDIMSTNGSSFVEYEAEMREGVEYALKNKGKEWAKLMNLLMQLRKCCNHPYMMPNSEPEPFLQGDHLILNSSKMILLDKLLTHLRSEGHRTLIFSEFTGMLDILEDYMIYKEIPYSRLDGSTVPARRNLDICFFQKEDSPKEVYLISTKAGGLGINLTKADTVIFYDSNWNPQVDIQALARAHRIGQTKLVKVYRLVCEGTVEEQMLTRLQKKLYLSEKVTADLRDPNAEEEAAPNLSRDALLSIFRKGARAVARLPVNTEDFFKADIADILKHSREHQLKVDKEEDGQDLDEKELLQGVEAIKTRMWEGKKVTKGKLTDIAEEWQQVSTKRVSHKRVEKIGSHMVLKETIGNAEWEAVATFSGKGARAETKRERKKFLRQTVRKNSALFCFLLAEKVLCSLHCQIISTVMIAAWGKPTETAVTAQGRIISGAFLQAPSAAQVNYLALSIAAMAVAEAQLTRAGCCTGVRLVRKPTDCVRWFEDHPKEKAKLQEKWEQDWKAVEKLPEGGVKVDEVKLKSKGTAPATPDTHKKKRAGATPGKGKAESKVKKEKGGSKRKSIANGTVNGFTNGIN